MAGGEQGIRIETYVCGPLSNNAYLLVWEQTGESLIIDTPADPGRLIDAARQTSVLGILITHSHQDHVAGLSEVRRSIPADVGIGAEDAEAVRRAGAEPTIDTSDGAIIRAGGIGLRAIHTPGHTAGSTCYLLEYPGTLFSGDTLFPGGPGRTGSPAAFSQLIKSITARLFVLPDGTAVLPGHGAGTTIGEARREYQDFASRQHPANLFGTVAWTD